VFTGTNVSLGAYPNFATLLFVTSTGSYICGGWLADARHVVTAAHCVTNPVTGVLNEPSKFYVYFNKLPGVSPFRPEPSYQAQALFAHPAYGSNGMSNDLGVVRLATAVAGVTPWAYASSPASLRLAAECTHYTVLGHGETCDGGCLSPTLLRVDVMKLNDAHCTRDVLDYDYRMWPAQTVGADACFGHAPPCASWGASQQHACAGDSGGPVFDGTSSLVVALVSRGSSKPCSQVVKPDIYTAVGNTDNAAWLNATIAAAYTEQSQQAPPPPRIRSATPPPVWVVGVRSSAPPHGIRDSFWEVPLVLIALALLV
jgi:trypsin